MLTSKYRSVFTCLLILTFGQSRQADADDPVSSTLETVTPERCSIKFVRNSTYATERPGIIDELPFQEGDIVQAGQLIVKLRDDVAQANLRLREAQAEMDTPIAVAEKERDAAKLAYESQVKANEIQARRGLDPAYPQSEIDRLRIIYEARIKQIEQAVDEFNLAPLARDQAKAELESYSVHAKFTGLVTRVHKHVGEAVNLGDEIITIIDPTRVRVEGKLSYGDARRIQVGDPVRIQLDLGRLDEARGRDLRTREFVNSREDASPRETLPEEQEVFAGFVGFIGVTTGDDQGLLDQFRIWAEVENRDNILLEGLPAKMIIQCGSK